MSLRNLKCRLHQYGLKRRDDIYDEVLVWQRADKTLKWTKVYREVTALFGAHFSLRECKFQAMSLNELSKNLI